VGGDAGGWRQERQAGGATKRRKTGSGQIGEKNLGKETNKKKKKKKK